MVDVSGKAVTARVAVAEGRVVMAAKTLELVLAGNAKKGDVLGAARIAGIMAGKRTHELIPLCHPLPVSKIAVEIEPDRTLPGLVVRATAQVTGQTGVEIQGGSRLENRRIQGAEGNLGKTAMAPDLFVVRHKRGGGSGGNECWLTSLSDKLVRAN